MTTQATTPAPAPAYALPVWVDGAVTNKGALPLWSGKAPPPAIGSEVICDDKPLTRVMVTGYAIQGGWLMVEGYRVADPSQRGNLAGAEIRGPASLPSLTLPELRTWARQTGQTRTSGGATSFPTLATLTRKRAALGTFALVRCDDSVTVYSSNGRRKTYKAGSPQALEIVRAKFA